MKWDDTYKYQASNKCYRWYDLFTGEGTDTDELLGYVRENLVDNTFMAQINDRMQPTAKFSNLKDAKNHVITYYVTKKLEGK